jgi:tetratricopeptide (TPR) repeat protein
VTARAGSRPNSDPRPAETGRRRRLLAASMIAVAMLAIVAYLPAIHGEFVWDDDAYVSQNPLLTAPDGLWKIWFSTDQPSQYFPLVYTTFRAERPLWGLHPTGYHVVNLLLHLVDALLVGLILRKLRVPGAWLAAAIFLLHPVQVESVAWITERKNVLMALFLGLSMLAWIRFTEDSREGCASPRAYWTSLALYAAALLSKTTACMAPAAQVLILGLRGERIDRRRWAQMAPFVALGLAMGLFTIWWERHHQGTRPELLPLDPLERLLLASRALWFYLGKLAWPANLAFSYPAWHIDARELGAWVWPALGAAAALALWRWRAGIGRGPIAAAGFYVAMLLPTSGVILLATFVYSYVADHYQYVACVGPIALACAAGHRATHRLGRRGRAASHVAAALLLVVLATLTWRQARAYRGPETLWRDTLRKNPQSWLAHNDLGTWLHAHGKVDEAIEHFRRALEIERGRPGPEARIRYNLANALAQRGEFAEAEGLYRQVLERRPMDAPAANNLGNVLLASGRLDAAVRAYRQAIESDPRYIQALLNLARILATTTDASVRDPVQAVAFAERAAARTGGDPDTMMVLATAYAASGRLADAAAAAERGAERTDPASPLGTELRRLVAAYRPGRVAR